MIICHENITMQNKLDIEIDTFSYSKYNFLLISYDFRVECDPDMFHPHAFSIYRLVPLIFSNNACVGYI